MRTTFSASGHNYVFEVRSGNEIVFYLKNSSENYKLLYDDFGYRVSKTRTVNSVRNSVAVFKKVRELVLDYLLTNRISYFWFSGNPDRLKIYRKFADSLERYGFGYNHFNGRFTFYRMIEN